jgi:signal transduction histidine kinase
VLEAGYKRGNDEKVGEGWEILKRNTSIMKELVLDLLSYSKPEHPNYEPADVNVICRDVASLMKGSASEKKVDIELDLHVAIGQVVLDPKGIYRCVLNLVTNAIDACTPNGGLIGISTEYLEDQDRFSISVSDNGCGIPHENLSKLFDVFYSTKGVDGTGLGLSVTKKIVEEHMGSISVESEPGRGTTFTIDLPVTPPTEEIIPV